MNSTLVAQSNFVQGYALKGTDTLWCEVKFDPKHDHAQKSVTLRIGSEETSFIAGGSITGYGLEYNGVYYDYGAVDVEIMIGPQRRANIIFIRKIVAGIIDLYEYEYKITTTRTTTRDGVVQPGSSSNSQSHTNYYIAKSDSLQPVLANPVLLPGYRKKDLERYLSDNAALFAKEEKKYSHKELIATLKEYNAARNKTPL